MDKKEELRMELSNDILSYIEKEMEKGFNEEEIKRALSAVGHEENIINHHLTHFKKKKEEKIANKKRRKKYMVAILALSILAILVLAIYLAYTTKNVNVTTTPSIPSEIINSNVSINNTTDEVVKEEPKQTSFVVGLDGNKNLSACDGTVDKEACITTTNLNIAIASLEPTECANTANIEACEATIYMALAKQKEDVTICNSIKAEDVKNDCIRFTAQALAIKQKNPELCNLIVNEVAKQVCIDVSK